MQEFGSGCVNTEDCVNSRQKEMPIDRSLQFIISRPSLSCVMSVIVLLNESKAPLTHVNVTLIIRIGLCG
jgi:hypothetical protein